MWCVVSGRCAVRACMVCVVYVGGAWWCVCVPTGWKEVTPQSGSPSPTPTLDPGSTMNTQTPDSLHLAKGQGKSKETLSSE